MTSKRQRKGKAGLRQHSKARLDQLVENNLAFPFATTVLGVAVTVERVDLTQREVIVALCRRAGVRQTVPLLDLPLPSRPPAGAQWIEAYRHWLGRG